MARFSTKVSQVCQLRPFDPSNAPPLLISAEMDWQEGGRLALSYGLVPQRLAPIDGLERWAMASPRGARKDELWHHTCFEAFLGLPGSDAYWELNVSPYGDWNLYRFSGYRSGGEPEPAACAPTLVLQQKTQALRCRTELDCSGFWPAAVVPEIGLTMVLEQPDGELSYWALSHPGDQADFHDRRSFLIP
jgi:hypothetical protein